MNAFSEVKQRPSADKKPSVPKHTTLSIMPPRSIGGFEIAGDPPPEKRQVVSKYDKLFGALKLGQAIRCDSKKTGTIASGLRKYLERHDIEGRVKICTNYSPDTTGKKGRVWLLPKGE